MLFFTDDDGTYVTNTRDSTPTSTREFDDGTDVVHLDTDVYDAHYAPGAYLPTHRDHWRNWHAEG